MLTKRHALAAGSPLISTRSACAERNAVQQSRAYCTSRKGSARCPNHDFLCPTLPNINPARNRIGVSMCSSHICRSISKHRALRVLKGALSLLRRSPARTHCLQPCKPADAATVCALQLNGMFESYIAARVAQRATAGKPVCQCMHMRMLQHNIWIDIYIYIYIDR